MKLFSQLNDLIPGPQAAVTWPLTVSALYLVARENYLLFHTMAEGSAIIVASLIYVLANRTYKHSGNTYLLFLGNAYFFIAALDFFHLITYKGMGIFQAYSPDTPTQLWIAGRYLEAMSLLLATFFIQRKFPRAVLFWTYALITGLLIAFIMWLQVFPACFVIGEGLTPFKIISEYIISLIITGTIMLLYLRKAQTNPSVYLTMTVAMTVTILSELSFTLYTDVYGIMNFVGHIFKIISYYLVYLGIVLRGIDAPYEMISEELKAGVVTDPLTGLYNRRGFIDLTQKELARARREKHPLGILLMDIDKFKIINDRYGHLVGDQVLKYFAGILKSSIRETDIACRLGGDEFVAVIYADLEGIGSIRQRILEEVKKWGAADEKVRELGVSIGTAVWEPGRPDDIDTLIREADKEMYREKNARNYKKRRVLWD